LLTALCDTYLARVPAYQGPIAPDADAAAVDAALAKVALVRNLFGFFPSYAGDSPLPACRDRVLHVDDASGVQSPFSFGGFGALARHLPRLTAALSDVLADESDTLLCRDCLCGVSSYLPSLTSTWLFQRAMPVPAAPAEAAAAAEAMSPTLGDGWCPPPRCRRSSPPPS